MKNLAKKKGAKYPRYCALLSLQMDVTVCDFDWHCYRPPPVELLFRITLCVILVSSGKAQLYKQLVMASQARDKRSKKRKADARLEDAREECGSYLER